MLRHTRCSLLAGVVGAGAGVAGSQTRVPLQAGCCMHGGTGGARCSSQVQAASTSVVPGCGLAGGMVANAKQPGWRPDSHAGPCCVNKVVAVQGQLAGPLRQQGHDCMCSSQVHAASTRFWLHVQLAGLRCVNKDMVVCAALRCRLLLHACVNMPRYHSLVGNLGLVVSLCAIRGHHRCACC